jgi:hypothetical protein
MIIPHLFQNEELFEQWFRIPNQTIVVEWGMSKVGYVEK